MADKFTVKRRSNRRKNIYRVEIFLRGRPQLSSCKIKAWKKFRPERLGFCKGSRNHPSGVNGLSHKAWWTTNIIFFAFFFSFCKYILVLEIIKWKNIRDYVFFTSTGWLEETFVFVWFFFSDIIRTVKSLFHGSLFSYWHYNAIQCGCEVICGWTTKLPEIVSHICWIITYYKLYKITAKSSFV